MLNANNISGRCYVRHQTSTGCPQAGYKITLTSPRHQIHSTETDMLYALI